MGQTLVPSTVEPAGKGRRALVDAILALHVRRHPMSPTLVVGAFCADCFYAWPCPTARLCGVTH